MCFTDEVEQPFSLKIGSECMQKMPFLQETFSIFHVKNYPRWKTFWWEGILQGMVFSWISGEIFQRFSEVKHTHVKILRQSWLSQVKMLAVLSQISNEAVSGQNTQVKLIV